MDITVIIILWGIILYQTIERILDRKARMKREEELINRIMAKSYHEYAVFKAKETVEKPIEQVKDYEQGIPIY